MIRTAVTTRESPGSLAKFKPEETAIRDSAFNGMRQAAQRIRDWEALEEAVDGQIAEQAAFVAWWETTITPNRSPDRKRRSAFSVDAAESETGISQQQVSRWRKKLEDRGSYRAYLFGSAWQKAMAETKPTTDGVHVTANSGNNEWYTPTQWIEAARSVLGTIDFDPASSEIANETVKATEYLTSNDDALSQEWPSGATWMNPPYSGDLVGQFADKFLSHTESGNSGIVLVNNATETRWFQGLAKGCRAVCFPAGRIRFQNSKGIDGAPLQGQALLYFGEDFDIFNDVFSEHGLVLEVPQ